MNIELRYWKGLLPFLLMLWVGIPLLIDLHDFFTNIGYQLATLITSVLLFVFTGVYAIYYYVELEYRNVKHNNLLPLF